MFTNRPLSDRRAERWRRAERVIWDVIVVGGGITGAGIAREAALSGLSAVVLEARDFAWGTSSRSTKMFHGGLRYLQKGEIRLVHEAGIERERMLSLSPHLVKPLPFLLPVYRNMRYGLTAVSLAVWLYDILAKVVPEERRRVVDRNEILRREPHLAAEGLKGAVLYHEYLTDDARLTVTVARSAAREGAEILNRAEVTDLILEQGRITGVAARDAETGQVHILHGRVVVNAAGPWIEQIVDKDPLNPRAGKKLLAHSRGIHLVFPGERVPLRHALALQSPDGRLVFCVPRPPVTFIGTTDVFYRGDLDHPPVPKEEIDYLLSIVRTAFPNLSVDAGHISGMWSGVRPLIYQPEKRAQDISRKDEIWRSPSGLVTVAGGKLTGFRKMARETLDAVFEELSAQQRYPRSLSFMKERGRRLSPFTPLIGELPVPPRDRETWFQEQVERLTAIYPVGRDQAEVLIDRYGAEAEVVLRRADPAQLRWIADGVPLLAAEIPYLIEEEMVLHLSDLIIRRTGLGWFGREQTRPHLHAVAREMAAVLGWDAERIEREVEDCRREAYWETEDDRNTDSPQPHTSFKPVVPS